MMLRNYFVSNESFSGIPFFMRIALVLILNGLFLSFYACPFLLKSEHEQKQKELVLKSLLWRYTHLQKCVVFVDLLNAA